MTDLTQANPLPIVEVAQAVAQTVANPSLPVLVEDLILIHNLVTNVRSQLAGKHPSVLNIFNALLNIQ